MYRGGCVCGWVCVCVCVCVCVEGAPVHTQFLLIQAKICVIFSFSPLSHIYRVSKKSLDHFKLE